MHNGLAGARVAGIVSEAAHYSNRSIAGWIGIGTSQLHAIPTDESLAMRLDLLGEKLEQLHGEGVRVAFVTATYGTTDGSGIDDVAGIRKIIDDFAARHSVPAPQLHVDAAVGWVQCFLTDYDLERNPLDFSPRVIELVGLAKQQAKGLQVADSITIDFHKMGWGHYPGSVFLVNRRSDLRYLSRSVEEMPYFSEADGRRDPALFTLECSRPALGPYTVMASLNGIGLTGWQLLVARSLELADTLKQRLEEIEYCKVLNTATTGPSVLWWVLPRGRDAKRIYEQVLNGEIPQDRFARYADEVRRMYDLRQKSMDPSKDARLSFTTSIGHAPNGIALPAWKAVLFNPKTDMAVIDRLIQGIEAML